MGERLGGRDHHLQPESFQASDQPVLSSLGMLLIKEIAAQFPILGAVTQDRKGSDQNLIRDGHNRFLHTEASRQPINNAVKWQFRLRVTAHADWHNARRIQRLPFLVRPLNRLPALS